MTLRPARRSRWRSATCATDQRRAFGNRRHGERARYAVAGHRFGAADGLVLLGTVVYALRRRPVGDDEDGLRLEEAPPSADDLTRQQQRLLLTIAPGRRLRGRQPAGGGISGEAGQPESGAAARDRGAARARRVSRMTTGAPMIEVRNVFKTFGPHQVLRGVSLTLDEGETVALFGPNGAGKTTLMRIIATLAQATADDVRIGGSRRVRRVTTSVVTSAW